MRNSLGGRCVWILKFLVILLVLMVGAGLAMLNPEPVRLDIYFIRLELPLSLILACTLSLGGMLGGIASMSFLLSTWRCTRRLRRRVQLTEQELGRLRTLLPRER